MVVPTVHYIEPKYKLWNNSRLEILIYMAIYGAD